MDSGRIYDVLVAGGSSLWRLQNGFPTSGINGNVKAQTLTVLGGAAIVAVMQPAHFGQFYPNTAFGRLHLTRLGGFFMRRFHIPVAPAIIGMILGPMAEQQFRRALAISQGDATVFFTEPLSAALIGLSI